MSELDRLTHLARAGRLSRRSFMERAAAIGLGIGAASTLADRVLAQAPKRGGLARFGLAHGATTDALDPATIPTPGPRCRSGARCRTA